MIFEEIRDFIKWYGKENTKELKETSKVLLELLEKKTSEDLARSRGEDV